MYCCGPTVYSNVHIGNLRTFLFQDLISRLLTIKNKAILLIRNITDVDDKIELGMFQKDKNLKNFTLKKTETFKKDCSKLNILKPDFEPSVNINVKKQVNFVIKLIGLRLVSQKKQSLYMKIKPYFNYSVRKNINYGETLNFVVWKGGSTVNKGLRVFWKNPWMFIGRPGWHLGCSALNINYTQSPLNLHVGGFDLKFPHHKNESFQAESITGRGFTKNWLHTGHLNINNLKMSKSLLNFYTINDLCGGSDGKPLNYLRLHLIKSKYNLSLNFKKKNFEYSVEVKLLYKALRFLDFRFKGNSSILKKNIIIKGYKSWSLFTFSWKKIQFSLDTVGCLSSVFKTVRSLFFFSRKGTRYALMALSQITNVLGLNLSLIKLKNQTFLVLKINFLKNLRRFVLSDNLRLKLKI